MPFQETLFAIYTQMQNIVVIFGFSTIIVGFLLGIFVYYWKNKHYNVWCNILSERGGGVGKYIGDRGAFLKMKDGSHVFRLKRAKVQIPQPTFRDFLIPATRSGMFIKNSLFLKQISQDEYVPMSPEVLFQTKTEYKTLDPKLDFWRIVSMEKARQKYYKAGFMEKWGGIMTLGLLAGVVIVVLALLLRNGQAYINQMAEISKNLQSTIQAQATTITTTATTPAPAPTSPF